MINTCKFVKSMEYFNDIDKCQFLASSYYHSNI